MKGLKTIFALCAGALGMAGCASVPTAAAARPASVSVVRKAAQADENIREQAFEFSLVAQHPYKAGSTDWQLVTTSQQLMGDCKSGFEGALFRSGEKYAFVFYGANARNDITDVIRTGFMGVPRHQLRDAQAFTQKAAGEYKFNASETRFIGHSMGGYLAKAVGTTVGAPEVWAFNSPGFKKRDPHRLEKLLGEPQGEAPEVFNFNSRQDVVGLWGHQPGQVFEVNTPGHHHTMSEMARALAPEGVTPPVAVSQEEPKRIGRIFSRIANSKIVQNMLHKRFRSPQP